MDENMLQSPLVEKKPQSSGQWLWKNLKPFGCVLSLLCLGAMLLICFTAGSDPVPGYEPPESMAFYAENLPALQQEIEENLIPCLEGEISCRVSEDRLEISISADKFATSRGAILRYFDESLFVFVKTE